MDTSIHECIAVIKFYITKILCPNTYMYMYMYLSIVSICEDGNMDLQTVMTNFGRTLRYINEGTGHYRLVRITNGKLQPPTGGWATISTYPPEKRGDCCHQQEPVRRDGLPKNNQY